MEYGNMGKNGLSARYDRFSFSSSIFVIATIENYKRFFSKIDSND